jgi:hypothetical protein
MGVAVAAIVMMKERQIVEAFERAGATTPGSARPFDTLDVEVHGVGMRRLRDRAVIREAAPGHFYLDAEVWQAVRRQRHRLAMVIILLIALPLAVLVGAGVVNR